MSHTLRGCGQLRHVWPRPLLEFYFVFLRSPKKAAKAAKAAKAPASKSSKGGGKVKKFTSAEYISNDESSGDQEAPGN